MTACFNREDSAGSGCSGRPGPVFHVYSSENLPWNAGKRPGDRTAVIVRDHSFDFLSAWNGYSWVKRHILNLKWRRIARKADRFIVFDRITAEKLVRYYYIPKEKIITAGDEGVLEDVLKGLSAGMRTDMAC